MKNLLLLLFSFSLAICSDNAKETPIPAYSYQGGWPVNPNSDIIEDPGFDQPCPGGMGCDCLSDKDCLNQNCRAHPKGNFCVPKPGDVVPRFEAIDQFGESVDLYDFAHQGKITILEISAAWCGACKDLSAWIATGNEAIKSRPWWKEKYTPIRDMIRSGEVQMVNFMYDSEVKKVTATPEDIRKWYESYPDPHVPVLADEYKFVHSWIKPTGLPCIFLLDENMKLINYTNRGLDDAFRYLADLKKP